VAEPLVVMTIFANYSKIKLQLKLFVLKHYLLIGIPFPIKLIFFFIGISYANDLVIYFGCCMSCKLLAS